MKSSEDNPFLHIQFIFVMNLYLFVNKRAEKRMQSDREYLLSLILLMPTDGVLDK